LGDVGAVREELGEDHEARDDGAAVWLGVGGDGGEQAVNPEAGFVAGGDGFEVEVGGAVAQGLGQELGDDVGGVEGWHGRIASYRNAGGGRRGELEANGGGLNLMA